MRHACGRAGKVAVPALLPALQKLLGDLPIERPTGLG